MVQRAAERELTRRQREVLELIARGYTNREIGERLGISLDGAKWHVSEVLARLDLRSREEAADYWRRQNGLRPRLLRWGTSLGGAMSLKALAAAAAAIAVVAATVATVLVVMGDADEPAPALPGATSPTPQPTPAESATPAANDRWGLTVSGESGDCSATLEFVFVARGFNPGETVELYRWNRLDETILEGTATAEPFGAGTMATFENVPLPGECFPGAEFVYEARLPIRVPDVIWPRVVFAVDQIGTLEVSPPVVRCGGVRTLTVSGSGLPPGMEMRFTVGDVFPLAHNFFGQGTGTVGPDGSLTGSIEFPLSCDRPGEMAVYGFDPSGVVQARWKAVFAFEPPTLTVSPATAECSDTSGLAFEGEGFPAGIQLQLVVHLGLDLERQVASVTTLSDGTFRLEAAFPDDLDCIPGSEWVFTAKPLDPQPGRPAASAVFTAKQIGEFWIEPDAGPCAVPTWITINGRDMPPGLELRFAWGEADPFAHVFAEFNERATVAPDGTFSQRVNVNFGCESGETEFGIYASPVGEEPRARWKAAYTVSSP